MIKKLRNYILLGLANVIYMLLALLSFIPFFKYLKYLGLEHRASFALNLGLVGYAEASANELLELSKIYEEDWNYGNAIHKGHTLLGVINVLRGNISKAEEELLASANTPGSPQLNTFGPNMKLASELLKRGRKDVVLQYLDKCKCFWEMGLDNIGYWSYQINKGEQPNFGGNLRY